MQPLTHVAVTANEVTARHPAGGAPTWPGHRRTLQYHARACGECGSQRVYIGFRGFVHMDMRVNASRCVCVLRSGCRTTPSLLHVALQTRRGINLPPFSTSLCRPGGGSTEPTCLSLSASRASPPPHAWLVIQANNESDNPHTIYYITYTTILSFLNVTSRRMRTPARHHNTMKAGRLCPSRSRVPRTERIRNDTRKETTCAIDGQSAASETEALTYTSKLFAMVLRQRESNTTTAWPSILLLEHTIIVRQGRR